MSTTFNRSVSEFFHDHHGVVSSAELSALDIGPQERRYLLDHGVLTVLFEGVYRLTASPLTFHGRCRAVCMADTSLTLCCHTAGTLLELRKCTTSWLHAVTNRRAKPIGSGVIVHRSLFELGDHVVERADGIRHTDALQTFFDLSKHVSDLTLRSIGEQMIADGLATHEALLAHVAVNATGGRPGSRRAVRVIGTRSAEGGAAESHGEVVLFEALRAAGMAGLERHPTVRLADGTLVHPDMGVPSIAFYIEVDHSTWHTQTADVEYDKERDLAVRITGGEVERVPTSRIEKDLQRTVIDLMARYRQRHANFGADVR